jgi:hypothetical protein
MFLNDHFFSLPPNQYTKDISIVLIPNETKVFISMQHSFIPHISFSKSYSYLKVKPTFNQLKDDIFDEDTNDYLKQSLLETSQVMQSGLLLQKYKEIPIEMALQIPQFQIDEKNMMSTVIRKKSFLEIIREEKPYELNLLLKNFSPLQDCEDIQLEWNEQKGENWNYWGEINVINSLRHGRGIYEKTTFTYIGYWKYDKFEGGMFLNNKKINYKGNLKNGQKHGFGTDYYSNGNYEQGYYYNNKREGIWFYHNVNKQFGCGLEYHNNQKLKSVKLSQQETLQIVEKNKKLENIYVGCNDKIGYLMEDNQNDNDSNSSIKNNNKCNSNIVQPNKQIKNNNKQPIVKDNFRQLNIISKEKIEFVNKINFFYSLDQFMTNQFLLLHPLNKEEKIDIIFSKKDTSIEYIGETLNGTKNGRGVYVNKNYYFIGYFNNDIPDGYFFVYDKNKVLKYKGKLSEYKVKKCIGKYYYSDKVSPYKKTYMKIKNEQYLISKRLDEVVGCFVKNDLLHGNGVSFTNQGMFSKNVFYDDGTLIYSDDKFNNKNYKPNDVLKSFTNGYPALLELVLKLPFKKV